MIRLNEKYAISFEHMNIVLYKIGVSGDKSKNKGKETLKPLGYFSNIEVLVDKLLYDEIADNNITDIKELIDKIDDFKKDILTALKECD